jgi:hypothetical protein
MLLSPPAARPLTDLYTWCSCFARIQCRKKTNLVPLDIDGRPLYALDQTELRFLRTMADLAGLTIAEFIDQAAEFLLTREAACDAKKNIVKFPMPLTGRRGRQ